MKTWLDLETYSELDLKEVGTYVYAANAEILLAAFAIDDGPVEVWDATCEPMPAKLRDALLKVQSDPTSELIAHNGAFDKAILNACLPALAPPLERWRCSMAQALSHALPASLGELCKVLKVPEDQAKLKEERKLVMLFCKPQAANRKVRRATRETHPAEWERFKKYAANDVVAMRECVARMPRWNWDASAIVEWHCDQRINERGFQVDTELTAAGALAATTEKARIGVRFRELTRGLVDRPSLRADFLKFLNSTYGLGIDNTRSETFQHLLKTRDLPADCAELLRLSIASNKTSTAKYAALAPATSNDGRFRGGLQFAGASRTRRWAGRIFQPQNLPSRGLPKAEQIAEYIDALKLGVHTDFFEPGELMRFGAAALRGVVIPRPSMRLAVADLSNIEGRMLAWLAGEQWKLQAFRDYDAGTGPDLYNVTAASIIGGDPYRVSKTNRNVFGKVPDLSCGYSGGVAGFQTFARAYGVKMADYWTTIRENISAGLIDRAHQNFDKWGHKQLADLEIDKSEWLASETCKLAWRARHPATVRFWYALGDAVKGAIREWGQVFQAGQWLKVRGVTHRGQRWLVIALPSGRYLTYFDPQLTDDGSITYMGDAAEQGSTTRMWTKVYTHPGMVCGNCFTASTQVLTLTGTKSICDVTSADWLWDGAEWVQSDGGVNQGKKEVGTWLGLSVTRNHLIFDGSTWRPAEKMDKATSLSALLWAQSSVHSPSFQQPPARKAAEPSAGASAAGRRTSACVNSLAGRASGAGLAPTWNSFSGSEKTQDSGRRKKFELHGTIGTNTWCDDATSRQMQHTPTTEHEASGSMNRGLPTGWPFLSTSGPSPDGMNWALISTGWTTTETTHRATSGLLLGRKISTTAVPQPVLSSEETATPSRNFAGASYRTGTPSIRFGTTKVSGETWSGSWRTTTRRRPVFDILNCGPRNRFTVLSDHGPVVVHNCCQTIARDQLMSALPVAEARGFTPVLTVHDEVIAEFPADGSLSYRDLVSIMATNQPWNPGLSLAAAGFDTMRYCKD